MRPCYCYILECADGTYYTGWTTDPSRREREHNAGRASRYTRSRRPVRLVYVEEQPDRRAAMKRERVIKAMTHAQKERLIRGAEKEAA
ncbi:MAG: GIY-YIG nuclease family protein [Anaerolineae bacterium]|nr:MAG: GIY-YIG nuclease family protein [Anaerolineae bacterium]